MAKKTAGEERKLKTNAKKRTSVGSSLKTRPKHKYKKKSHKPSRGQGSGRK